MTISLRAATGITATSDTKAPFGNLTYTLPTGHSTDDLLIAFYGGKPYNTVPSTPTDYTAQSGGANGSTAMGAGSGSVYAVAFTKVHDGSESNPTSTFAAQYSPGIRAMIALDSDVSGSGWSVESTNGSDSTATGTTFSATGASTISLTTGDWIVVLLVHNDDSSSDSAFAITVPGCTLGSVTQQLTGTLTTATGNDGRMYVLTAPIDSGTASGAPTVTATTGTNDSDGQAVFLAVKEPVNNDKTGTVSGALPSLSGTVTGTGAHTGTVTGAVALSGSATGTKKTTSTVAGAVALSGSGTGTKKTTGTVAGSMSLGGTVVGTKSETSNDKTGTVAGSIALTGTVAGAKATTGTAVGTVTLAGTEAGTKGGQGAVTGAVSLSGTVEGTEGRTVAVAGEITLTGTVAGTKKTTGTVAGALTLSGTVTGQVEYPDRNGTVTGAITLTGTVVGTKYDPDAPVTQPSGGHPRYLAWDQPQQGWVTERKRGSAHGAIAVRATVTGTARQSARGYVRDTIRLCGTGNATGTKHASATIRSRAVHASAEVRGDGVFQMSTRMLTLMREDDLVIIEELQHG